MQRQLLLYANTQNNADMLYFSGVSVPDAFFAFTLNGEPSALISPLELGRVSKKSKFKNIFDSSEIAKKLPKNLPRDEVASISFLLKQKKIKNLLVPSDFPSLFLEKLRKNGFDILVSDKKIFPQRDVKSKFELTEIAKANNVASAGFGLVEQILKESTERDNKLFWKDKILSSQILRAEIEKLAITMGADALQTIVASGNQACDPHEVGYGAISARSLIVVDIFPRLRNSGYFGDMTRTFIKGTPSDAQAMLVQTVFEAQKRAFNALKAGVSGAKIHNIVDDFFEDCGYFTEFKKGAWQGFFHSTGHGVGLDIHESPSLSVRGGILEVGNVVTVEPGLYYKGIGGCRIEDTVVIEKNRARKLSNFHYNWVVK